MQLERPVTIDDVLRAVCQLDGVGYPDLVGPSRTNLLAQARRRAARVLSMLGHSRSQIADALNRDHSTICKGLRRGTPGDPHAECSTVLMVVAARRGIEGDAAQRAMVRAAMGEASA